MIFMCTLKRRRLAFVDKLSFWTMIFFPLTLVIALPSTFYICPTTTLVIIFLLMAINDCVFLIQGR